VGAGVVALLMVAGIVWWWYASGYESTEDAYVDTTSSFVSPQVTGQVEEVLVKGNRFVAAGDLLVRLDASDYRIAVTHAEAEVARARARLDSAQVEVDYTRDRSDAGVQGAEARLAALRQGREAAAAELTRREAEVEAATADLDLARQDLERIRTLFDKGAISRRELDRAVSDASVQEAQLEVAHAAVKAQEQQLTAADQQLEEARAQVDAARAEHLSTQMKALDAETLDAELKQAEAALEKARLDLEHTEIRAPIDGFVSRKSVEVGNFVQPGQPLMAIVALERAWVEANFKEDQIEHIRVGQPATIVADTYPDRVFHGHVDSVSSGTGDAFSLLPPVNATGNWIKVTRRVPVKIVLDEPPPEEYPLRIGMTTTVTVDVRDRSGARLVTDSRAQRP
jgi:membrane fusion protein (multidrug efflux system)